MIRPDALLPGVTLSIPNTNLDIEAFIQGDLEARIEPGKFPLVTP
jgi:hypothetical protein